MNNLLKTVSETFPIDINFANDLITDETILSQVTSLMDTATNTVVTGVVITEVISSPKVILTLSGGVLNKTYKITTTITTSDTNILTKTVILQVVDTVEATFNKIDTETILFKVDFSDYLPPGDVISSVIATAIDNTSNTNISTPFIVGAGISESVNVLVKVTGGTIGHDVRILVQVVTTASATLEVNIVAHIRRT